MPQVLGAITRKYGDFDAAEDAVQEAMITAFDRWPREGIPDNPRAWLITAASRRLIDRWRGELSRREREELHARRETPPPETADGDDTLTLLFLCCHPELTAASAIALTLRAVGGLTTEEIARAFLVPSATMGQRISRAKSKIKSAGASFSPPAESEQDARLESVLRVLYLIFNEGYVATSGERLHRVELTSEAIRLTRVLADRLPGEGEVTGLLALMLLLDARRPARTDDTGAVVPLPDQDRTRWNWTMISEGHSLLDRALVGGRVGEYQLQAAIAAVHDRSETAADTDWSQILALYGLLERVTPSPVITLNRAVAASMAHGPDAGLKVLAEVQPDSAGEQRFLSVRGHLKEQAGDLEAAAADYLAASRIATSEPERQHLILQASRLASGQRGQEEFGG